MAAEADVQFFTVEWWRGDDESDPFPSYRAHIAALRSKLVPDLLAIDERVSLHDAWLRDLVLNPTAGTLQLVLDGDDHGELCKITLRYAKVTLFHCIADPEKGLPGPHGYGDLGYDEIDLAGNEFVHRILFSSGVEFEIRFGGFTLKVEPAIQRGC